MDNAFELPSVEFDKSKLRVLHLAEHVTRKDLRYVIEVIGLSWFESFARIDAQKEVAKRHGIEVGTVMEAFCARLGGVSARDFDQLLDAQNLVELKRALFRRFKNDPYCNNVICALIRELGKHKRGTSLPSALRKAIARMDRPACEELIAKLKSSLNDASSGGESELTSIR